MYTNVNGFSKVFPRGVLTRARRGRAGNSKGWRRQRHPLRQDVETVAYYMLNGWKRNVLTESALL